MNKLIAHSRRELAKRYVLVATIGLVAGLTAGVGLGAGVVIANTPCPTEDSVNCVWDAANRGNGYGQPFVTVGEVTIPVGQKIMPCDDLPDGPVPEGTVCGVTE